MSICIGGKNGVVCPWEYLAACGSAVERVFFPICVRYITSGTRVRFDFLENFSPFIISEDRFLVSLGQYGSWGSS
jgi:hypothetical protein